MVLKMKASQSKVNISE